MRALKLLAVLLTSAIALTAFIKGAPVAGNITVDDTPSRFDNLKKDSSFKVTIVNETTGPLILENSLFKATYASVKSETAPREFAIKSLLLKIHGGQEQIKGEGVAWKLDGANFRNGLKKLTIVKDEPDVKTVRIAYHDNNFQGISSVGTIAEVSIFPHSPVIRTKYLRYGKKFVTVDLCSPGGASAEQVRYKIYGDDKYIRGHVLSGDSTYWCGLTSESFPHQCLKSDPDDGGSLNYHNHLIATVYNPKNQVGFGRVMPIYRPGHGGIRMLRLIAVVPGFSTYPSWMSSNQLPFTGYLFFFKASPDSAIAMGKRIADGDTLFVKPEK